MKKYLVHHLAIHEEQIYTVSFGEKKLDDYSHIAEAWKLNRRVEFDLH